jgi:AcrR family transcriptional regulator
VHVTAQPPGLRADAQLNRERILDVAREALSASADASLNSIAKAAGVGAGTLYRHFPTREALLLAVYDNDVRQISDSAGALLRQHAPLEAMRRWFQSLAVAIRLKNGFPDVFHSASGDALIRDSYAPVLAAIATMLDAGVSDGSIRAGVEPHDLLLLMGFLWRIDPGHDAGAQAERMLDVVIAGLRAT